MWHRPTCGEVHIQKLLALLNHSFWGVHIVGRNQSFTSWGVHIAGRNWAFSCAVEKLSRHCPGMEYQHKRGHTSNILCKIQKITAFSAALKFAEISHTTRGATTAANGMMNVRWLSHQLPIASKPYPTTTVPTGNCRRLYPKIWPYTDHPVWTAGGDWYAQAVCTGNQVIYQGALAPHLFHWLYHCTGSATHTVL